MMNPISFNNRQTFNAILPSSMPLDKQNPGILVDEPQKRDRLDSQNNVFFRETLGNSCVRIHLSDENLLKLQEIFGTDSIKEDTNSLLLTGKAEKFVSSWYAKFSSQSNYTIHLNVIGFLKNLGVEECIFQPHGDNPLEVSEYLLKIQKEAMEEWKQKAIKNGNLSLASLKEIFVALKESPENAMEILSKIHEIQESKGYDSAFKEIMDYTKLDKETLQNNPNFEEDIIGIVQEIAQNPAQIRGRLEIIA